MQKLFESFRRTLKSWRRFGFLSPVIRILELTYLVLKFQLQGSRNLRLLNRSWGKRKLNLIVLREVSELHIPQPEGIYCYNPTIVSYHGKLLGFARTSNISYKPKLDFFGRSMLRTEVSFLLNGIVSFELGSKFEVIDASVFRPLERVPNFEDPKAVILDDSIHLFCNMVSKEQDKSDRAIHCLNASLNVANGTLVNYPSPFQKNIEKNWIPFVSTDSILSFCYSTHPQIILNFARNSTEVSIKKLSEVSKYNLHGGSQIVELMPDLFLRVARRRISLSNRRIAILSYLIFQNAEGEIVRVGKPFVFRKFGFEICNGLTRVGQDLILSWGEDDIRMFAGKISIQELLKWDSI